ncbi:MAG: hypothetical protein ACYC5N_06930 [Endomicrobiales bacterium]
MKNNQKNKKNKTAHVPEKAAGISQTGKKVIMAGILVLIAGFLVLTRTDPAGQNWASNLSPFLILGGYALIGTGIVVPEKKLPSHL